MQEPELFSILNAFASPILVAKPVREGSITKDFGLVFLNDAFKKQVDPSISSCKLYSEFKDKLSVNVAWLDMADKAMNKIENPPQIYYSEISKAWFRVSMHCSESGLLVVSLENVTTLHDQDVELKQSAYTDRLTGLPNRNKFNLEFPKTIETASFCGNKLAILLIDIDNMKNINDSKGNKEGDKILQNVAEILNQFNKNRIYAYRYGDDEFIVIIERFDSIDTLINITDTIFESFVLQDIKISGGISVYPENSEEPEDLIRFADIAMHVAKKNGKNNFVYFQPDMQRVFIQKLNILNKMTQAVLSSSFKQVYQPQFDVKSGQLRGFEALIRWNDSELGNISPSFFIPLAEECGLIIPIGNWVLNTAFETLSYWQKNYDFKGIISVNISPIQLKQETFLEDIADLLKKYNINPKYIEIEITEGIMIENMNDAISKMKLLKDMGFKISLDDFGTGYSSLSYLQMLPLDTLKIDKSFINDITGKDGIQATITNSIISMVTQMGLDTIAEGVEKIDQYDLLKKFNCHIIQGFLKGMPMDRSICEQYLAGNHNALLSLENEKIL